MNNKANWPIRVGGEYPPTRNTSASWLGCRVTAIDGDEIHYILRTKHYDGEIVEHTPTSASAGLFRNCYCPEDQSPMPALIEALRGINAGTVNSFDDERVVVDVSIGAWKAMEAALAASSEHPDSVVEEVSQ
jgi:hypothetical protein